MYSTFDSYSFTSAPIKSFLFVGVFILALVFIFLFVVSQHEMKVLARYLLLFSIAFLIILLGFVYSFGALGAVIVTETGFEIKSIFHNKTIEKEKIIVEELKIIDAAIETKLSQKRIFGISMPGLDYGWYKLLNGEKSFFAVADGNDIIYIRTTLGYSYMLSIENSSDLLESLLTK